MKMIQEFQTLSQDPNQMVPSGERLDVEVVAVAKRRRFSTTYKRRIVREAAACDAVGAIGALQCTLNSVRDIVERGATDERSKFEAFDH